MHTMKLKIRKYEKRWQIWIRTQQTIDVEGIGYHEMDLAYMRIQLINKELNRTEIKKKQKVNAKISHYFHKINIHFLIRYI